MAPFFVLMQKNAPGRILSEIFYPFSLLINLL